MKAWKRNLLIAYLLCNVLMVIFFYMLMLDSSLAGFVKFLLFVVGLVVIAGICVGIYVVVYAFAHEHATLHAGPGGIINIERSALESTARRALASVKDITVQHVRANVIERKGEPVIDVTVTAIPYGEESLMTTASQIQTAVKRSVEGFTDHEVRYVAVNFVEPRKRDEVKAAAAVVDKRVASGDVAPRYTPGSAAKTDGDVAATQKKASSPAPAAVSSVPVAEPATPKASLWDRAKARMASTREAKDEDVVETEAVVETVATPDPVASAPAPSASQEPEPQPVVETAPQVDETVAANIEEPVEGVAVRDDNTSEQAR